MKIILIELYNNSNYEFEDYFFDIKKQCLTKHIPNINISNIDNKLITKINYSLETFLERNRNFQLINKTLIERRFSKTGVFEVKILKQIA